jgi:hypothetical protein
VIETLTLSQLGQIENVMNSSESDETKRSQIDLIVNQ